MAITAPDVPVEVVEDEVSEEILLPLESGGASSVSLIEIIPISFESLFANKTRSLLTMLGIIIGVASVVALMALGNGATASITSQVQGLGTNILTITPGSPREGGPGLSAPQPLTLSDAEAIRALPLPVVGVAPQYGSRAQIVAPAADTNATINGVTTDHQA